MFSALALQNNFVTLCLLFISFVPEKGFAGADGARRDDGPVQFEKEDANPFGLKNFFQYAEAGKSGHDEESGSRLVSHTCSLD